MGHILIWTSHAGRGEYQRRGLRKEPNMEIRECVECHKSYQPVKGNQKRCAVCKNKGPKDKTHTMVCAYCGKQFTTDIYNRIYCSPKCREAVPKEKMPHYTRICAFCGKEYTATKISRIYCSKECAREGKRAKDNAWRTQHV